MLKLNLVITSSLLGLIAPITGNTMVPPYSAPSSVEYKLAQKATERRQQEHLAETTSKSGHPEDTLYHYAKAAFLSLEILDLTGKLPQAYCSLLTFKSSVSGVKLTECDEDARDETACRKKEMIELFQCADTQALCQKVTDAWKPVAAVRKLVIVKEKPCLPVVGL